ncbi:hypothetical protein [Streptomyces orinoci]|uniref:Uncharacterized protein n=1 Tax=Streptomyces orinoci TaxID=67339 RepID=A0ABV3K0V7_STRON|nr:hypothetical protein [Streptomyces orinoci]
MLDGGSTEQISLGLFPANSHSRRASIPAERAARLTELGMRGSRAVGAQSSGCAASALPLDHDSEQALGAGSGTAFTGREAVGDLGHEVCLSTAGSFPDVGSVRCPGFRGR